MKSKNLLSRMLLIVTAYCCFSPLAFALYTGENNPIAVSSEQVKNLPDGTMVTMEGRIIQKVGDNDYIFSSKKNGSSSLVLLVFDNGVGLQTSFDDNTMIRIQGHVDWNQRQPISVKVSKLELAKKGGNE